MENVTPPQLLAYVYFMRAMSSTAQPQFSNAGSSSSSVIRQGASEAWQQMVKMVFAVDAAPHLL